jgi:hypothetical protein
MTFLLSNDLANGTASISPTGDVPPSDGQNDQVDPTARERAVELRVAELRAGGAAGLMRDAQLPDVGNVIERYSERRHVEPASDGAGEELVLTIPFA